MRYDKEKILNQYIDLYYKGLIHQDIVQTIQKETGIKTSLLSQIISAFPNRRFKCIICGSTLVKEKQVGGQQTCKICASPEKRLQRKALSCEKYYEKQKKRYRTKYKSKQKRVMSVYCFTTGKYNYL